MQHATYQNHSCCHAISMQYLQEHLQQIRNDSGTKVTSDVDCHYDDIEQHPRETMAILEGSNCNPLIKKVYGYAMATKLCESSISYYPNNETVSVATDTIILVQDKTLLTHYWFSNGLQHFTWFPMLHACISCKLLVYILYNLYHFGLELIADVILHRIIYICATLMMGIKLVMWSIKHQVWLLTQTFDRDHWTLPFPTTSL